LAGLFVLGFSGLVGGKLWAADQNPNEIIPPAGPAWIAPKPPMSWVINFRYPAASAKDPTLESQPVQVSVSAIGAVTLEHIKFPKTNYDVWKLEGFTFLAEAETGRFGLRRNPRDFFAAEPGQPATVLPPPPAEYQDWLGLKEFDWVKSELFRGTIKQGTETLHVYAQMPPDMLSGRPAAAGTAVAGTAVAGTAGTAVTAAQRPPVAPAVAPAVVGKPVVGTPGAVGRPAPAGPPAKKWPPGPLGGLPLRPDIKVVAVNAETRQPRFLQLGETVREYVFSVPAADPLEVPKPILQLMKTLGR